MVKGEERKTEKEGQWPVRAGKKDRTVRGVQRVCREGRRRERQERGSTR